MEDQKTCIRCKVYPWKVECYGHRLCLHCHAMQSVRDSCKEEPLTEQPPAAVETETDQLRRLNADIANMVKDDYYAKNVQRITETLGVLDLIMLRGILKHIEIHAYYRGKMDGLREAGCDQA